jgi:prephenate dehydrogenase
MKLALIGVGLIGGSAAAAWRQAGRVTSVTGYDPDPDALRTAQARGLLDSVAPSIGAAVAEVDLVLLAVPVGAMRAVLAEVAQQVPPHAVITDVGSTKASVIGDARAALMANSSFSLRRFVPAHPIAGGERGGVAHASAELFRGRTCVLTPLAETHAAALEQVRTLWQAAGAHPVQMTAAAHDETFAAVSHLPHLLAYALVDCVARQPDAATMFALAGPGFRDATRIAASDPALWRDIALANQTALSAQLLRLRAALEAMQRDLDAGDGAALEARFTRAATARRALPESAA